LDGGGVEREGVESWKREEGRKDEWVSSTFHLSQLPSRPETELEKRPTSRKSSGERCGLEEVALVRREGRRGREGCRDEESHKTPS